MTPRTGRLLAAIAVALALSVPGGGAQSSVTEPAVGTVGPLPDELALVLEAKAAGYARRALGFSCRERVRRAAYSGQQAGDEKVDEYDFLLVRDESSPVGFRGFRTRPGSESGREKQIDLPFPDAPLWAQLFSPSIRSTLRYSVGDWHTTPYRLAIPISWYSAAPVFENRRITEWSGTVEIEYRTGNLVRLTARPTLQDERVRAELMRYLTAFRFLGWSAAPAPIGLELEVEFDFEQDGFSYPTRVELRTFRQVHVDQRITIARRVVEYGEYKFFGTTVVDHIPPLTYRPPGSEAPLPVPAERPGPG